MDKTHSFLIEIGTEEMPANCLSTLSTAFQSSLLQHLNEAGITFSDHQCYATPRRLALVINQLASKQTDQFIEKMGPMINAPKQAIAGFANSCHVSIEQLEKQMTEKGERYVHRYQQIGKPTQDCLPHFIEQTLKHLPMGRTMRWGASPIEFIRPIQWITLLFDYQCIKTTIFELETIGHSYGHRFLHPEIISFDRKKTYEEQWLDGYVMADFEKRREHIRQQLMAFSNEKQHVYIDASLLNEVTGLVEWPIALLIPFDRTFLTLPKEVLITSMQAHQKCFALLDPNEQLQPYFVTISNIQSRDPAQVIEGNQRVMHARLSDAAFFYETDTKQPLRERLNTLKHITYQAKLGSLYDKTQRLQKLASQLAPLLCLDATDAQQAIELAKCDLVTDMVGEFPTLQGIMGHYYAVNDGESETIGKAIQEQYLPRFSEDALPETVLGCLFALSDKIDTLIGHFGIHQIPTGTKDPYALRRAALGIVRILIEKKYELNIKTLLEYAYSIYQQPLPNDNTVSQVHTFLLERLRAWYLEHGISKDTLSAVISQQPNDLFDLKNRLYAVHDFSNTEQSLSLAAANKRVHNLLRKQNDPLIDTVQSTLFEHDVERTLAKAISNKKERIQPLLKTRDYALILKELSELQTPLDNFFEQVMVMAEEKQVRQNRLRLLADLRELFLQVADLSLLAS